MKTFPSEILKAMVGTRFLHWFGIFVLLLLLNLFAIPLNRQLDYLQGKKAKLQDKITKTEGMALKQKEFEASYDEKKRELQQLRMGILKKGEQAKVISVITRITKGLGNTILNLNPLTLPTPSSPEAKKLNPLLFQLEMEGNYSSAGIFFEKLREAKPILRIQEFQMEPKQPNSDLLKMQIKLLAYEENF